MWADGGKIKQKKKKKEEETEDKFSGKGQQLHRFMKSDKA